MKPYLVALAMGLLVGVLYGLLNVRSPAPPVIALLGLLGMLVGEQVVPITQRLVSGQGIDAAWVRTACVPPILGGMPAPKPAGQEPCHASRADVSPDHVSPTQASPDRPAQRTLHDT
ncbi:MAG: DUF1427 family protein [Geminicoccaceae bacterium]